ncbi:glycerol-3-phosphate acyltransferase [Spirulina sp. CS-785/01]|uniref:glycerol-3-phosphate acyltransferase n=1 Tax=Spirulina sp. CS-785/01 TaxID=3021716 RepID=UPI00232DA842|nr:glycerol-3-phosphate acyltransferase [Spirulina sp. CS-785/01]MDB9314448.1 glycerol-3-phosphate acyltransferase [Spirulina sp. CS-785/01]
MTAIWGFLSIFLLCPLLGGLPLVDWITRTFANKNLRELGTGNLSVSAAFYHGGTTIGVLAVLSEAGKGLVAVAIARYFFPQYPVWELIALITLVLGRYWMGKGAGTTNVVWGLLLHDPIATGLILLIGGISFTIFRERVTGRYVGLFLLAFILTLQRPNDPDYILAAITLAVLIGWIYQLIPDDLDLPEQQAKSNSQTVFRFFRGDNAILTLQDKLEARKVGRKAATLAQLKRWNYPVPDGWVLPAGDDSQPLLLSLEPSVQQPFVVRSSAVGEDSETASAAGQYITVANVTTSEELSEAILRCQTSYNNPSAVQYRRDAQTREKKRKSRNISLSVIIQKQIQGAFSGVAFSRDPVNRYSDAVVLEALPGDAAQVVSGHTTPDRYRVFLDRSESQSEQETVQINENSPPCVIEGQGETPFRIIQEVAQLARDLENRFHGIPQDIEWTHDGQQLWILQSRPITNLQPIWTRKIAAEVIPGAIPPLTWSINRPLTCGVWGDIFTVVLGEDQAADLNFEETATQHYSNVYFNATLLGQIFRRMGLPPESLEFLTRGTKFSRPPLLSTLKNIPGLLRLLGREWHLTRDFEQDYQKWFSPTLNQLKYPPNSFNEEELLTRIDLILSTLRRSTYYSILTPLSLSFRRAILGVSEQELENRNTPEVASLVALAALASKTRNLLPMEQLQFDSCPSLFAYLAEYPDGENVLKQFNEWLETYGYLSETATDISVPRWRENPRPMRQLFTQYIFDEHQRWQIEQQAKSDTNSNILNLVVQRRLNLKGKSTEVYSRLLAHLRWTFLALEKIWLEKDWLQEEGDLFFLKLPEIRSIIEDNDTHLQTRLLELIDQRRKQWKKDKTISNLPFVVYGKPREDDLPPISPLPSQQQLQGIAGSPGIAEGEIKIMRNLGEISSLSRDTILVVPYTDSGWSPFLAQAGGIIAEVGGQLSHGAIVAREYGIPAVMDVHNALTLFKNGQRVRIDGEQGIVELLD